jgi:hypothetical protein
MLLVTFTLPAMQESLNFRKHTRIVRRTLAIILSLEASEQDSQLLDAFRLYSADNALMMPTVVATKWTPRRLPFGLERTRHD